MADEEDWLASACAAKGLAPGSTEAGEELFAGVGTFVRMARLLRDALRDIAKEGRPAFAGPVREAPDGRLRVQVFPGGAFDRITFPQTTAEIWMQPGVTRESLVSGQAAAYTDPAAHAGTALVLAAGNVASLGPRDVLSKLFVEGKVVVLKANPVNDYLVPYWSRALAPLIDAGVLCIVDGGAAVGRYLTGHARIDEVHITGSDKTYDAVVFGSGADGVRHKEADDPVLDKPVTAELGSVSPVIVVPGRWSIAELLYQAEHVATMLVNNAGFNCISARVIVTHAAWQQREAFLGALTQTLAGITTRRAYYPGAAERRDAFVAAHPEAEEYGSGPDDALPWTFIRNVPPGQTGDICFNVESFFGQVAETALTAPSPAAFVDAATEFCNDVIWGTLGVTVIVSPSSLKDSDLADSVDRARNRTCATAQSASTSGMGCLSQWARRVGGHTPDTRATTSSPAPGWSATRPCSTGRRSRSCAVRSGPGPSSPWFKPRRRTPSRSCAGSWRSRQSPQRPGSQGSFLPPCGTDAGCSTHGLGAQLRNRERSGGDDCCGESNERKERPADPGNTITARLEDEPKEDEYEVEDSGRHRDSDVWHVCVDRQLFPSCAEDEVSDDQNAGDHHEVEVPVGAHTAPVKNHDAEVVIEPRQEERDEKHQSRDPGDPVG